MEKIYTLTTFWLDKTPDEKGYYHRNTCNQGFFRSEEEAKEFLLERWWDLHEHWNNAAVIEEYSMGSTESQWRPKQLWFVSDDPVNKLPEVLSEAPEEMKFNSGRQTCTLGR